MNEKNDNASCLSEEPLISADQVMKGTFLMIRLDIENMKVCDAASFSVFHLCPSSLHLFRFFSPGLSSRSLRRLWR